MKTVAGLLLTSLIALAPTVARAQQPGYPYAQPSYGPPPGGPSTLPPPQYYYAPAPPPPPPPYVVARRSDPFAGRFARVYAGTSGFGSFVLHQSGGVESVRSGGGYSVFGGVDLGRVVGIQLSYSDSLHNPDGGCDPSYGLCTSSHLHLETVSADLRLHLPLGHFRPYVQVGVGTAWIGRPTYPSDAVGLAWDAGGGFDYFIGRWVSLGATVLYHGVRLDDYGTYTGSLTELSMLTAEGNFALHF